MVKTSVFVLSPDIKAIEDCEILNGELAYTVEKAKYLGYDAVEIDIGDPDIFDTDSAIEILKEKEMGISVVNSGNINYAFNVSLVNADPKKEQKAFEMLQGIIRVSSKMGCITQVGVSRGVAIPGKPVPYFKSKLVAVLKDACDYASKLGANLVLEYTNRFEINTINTFEEARDIIDRVGKSNLGMLIDTYHSYLEDPDVYDTIRAAKDYVKHFHLHDSDRGPAGASDGVLDFELIMRILKSIGFNGYLSDGLLTLKVPEEQTLRSTAFLKDMIRAYQL